MDALVGKMVDIHLSDASSLTGTLGKLGNDFFLTIGDRQVFFNGAQVTYYEVT